MVEASQMTIRFDTELTDFENTRSHPSTNWLLSGGERIYRGTFKRLLDIVLVLLAAPIVVPTVAILALLTALDGHSPFYKQTRLGQGGRMFTLWKLRTMVVDADRRLADHLLSSEKARLEWNAYQKLASDPRITMVGLLLRKSSLDELPQLWNVLKGDMSLVGPRPMMPEQRVLYPGHAYFALRPGLTGLWQVSDRNASTFAQRAEFDTLYEREVSLLTDVKVLFATVGAVLRATGK
jgi:lipopolysaccharide/colanic/teichoic acid biosynthesis glycosyltransferase